jgi:hypothetical protein
MFNHSYSILGLSLNLTLILTASQPWPKQRLVDEKEPILSHPPPPCTALWGGGGKGGARATALNICLIKTWVTHKLSSKAYWKWHFKWKPLKQKSLMRFFARYFWFFSQKQYDRRLNLTCIRVVAIRVKLCFFAAALSLCSAMLGTSLEHWLGISR